jgi:predicted RNA-binding Zn-ribbon protein involved in translation (DUF1610 family)
MDRMGEPDVTDEFLRVQCPHCGTSLRTEWKHLGEPLECAHCGQPFDVTLPPPTRPPPGRLFQFQCLRCGSVLEARSSQAGRQGKCPSCAAIFTVPELDPRTGLARTNADPGEDGENPAPVHAYAAAGTMAPQILRREDERLSIRCPRCQTDSEISANACPKCGLPFTMEGMTFRPMTASTPLGWTTATLGIVAILLSCTPAGIVPAVIAIGCGLYSWSDRSLSGASGVKLGLVLGIIAAMIFGVRLLS